MIGEKRGKQFQEYFKATMKGELEDTVLTHPNDTRWTQYIGFDFDKMMNLQKRLMIDIAIIKLKHQDIIQLPNKRRFHAKQLIFSNGEVLFKKLDQKIWGLIIKLLDFTSAYNLIYVSKYFYYGIPDFWSALLFSHYRFGRPVEIKSQIANFDKKLVMGQRYMKFIQSLDTSQKRLLSISDILDRASHADIIQYTDALLDMMVLHSELYKKFAYQSQSRESDPPYLMLSLFSDEQKVILWRFRIAVRSHGYIRLCFFIAFYFGDFDLNPRYAKFLGTDRFYVEFKQPCLRIYNLTKINICSNDPDETADTYEFELSFEDSQLVVRNHLDADGEEEESRYDVSFPCDSTAEWRMICLEGNAIMCLESKSNTLVLLNISNDQQLCSCRVVVLEHESKDSLLKNIWIPPQVEKEYRRVYLVNNTLSIYQLKLDSGWNKSRSFEKIQLTHIFDSSKIPELSQNCGLSKRFEFVSWIKDRKIYDKPEKNVYACIMHALKRFFLIDLETGDFKEIVLDQSVIVREWFVFNNLLFYMSKKNMNQVSLYLDYYFGISTESQSLAGIDNSQQEIHFLRFDCFITLVKAAGDLQLMWFHISDFQVELISDEIHLDVPKPKNKRLKFEIQPFETMKFEMKSIKKLENFSCITETQIEVKDSVVFLRGLNTVCFVDILSKYKTFQKRANNRTIFSTTLNAIEDAEPKKLKLINYQELHSNPNKAVKTELIFQRLQDYLINIAEEELRNSTKEKPKNHEDPKCKTNAKVLEKMKKVQEVEESPEKEKKKTKEKNKAKERKNEIYNKYFGVTENYLGESFVVLGHSTSINVYQEINSKSND